MVSWFASNEQPVLEATSLTVIDRVSFPGDVVARTSEPQGQMGTVIGLMLTFELNIISLELGQKIETISNVKAEDCRLPLPYREGACVVAGEWMGAILEVEVDVYVRFPNGALGLAHNCTTDLLSRADDALTDGQYTLSERVYLTAAGINQITWLSKETVGARNKRQRWGRVIDLKATNLHVACVWLWSL